MTSIAQRRNQIARPLRFAASGLAVAFLLSACSGSSGVKVNRDATTAAPTSSAATTAASVSPGSPDINQMLAAYASGYQFTTTLTVNGAVVATVQGRRVNDTSSLTATQNGITVDYVVTTAGAWIRSPGQEWQQVDAPGIADPLLPLRSPKSVKVQSDGTIDAIYSADLFGMPKGDVSVIFTPANGVISKVRYDTTANGQPATSETTFAALTDSSPITAPA